MACELAQAASDDNKLHRAVIRDQRRENPEIRSATVLDETAYEGEHEASVRRIGSTVVTELGRLRHWYRRQPSDLASSGPTLLQGSPSLPSVTPTPDGTPPSVCITGRGSG